jgi:hypothetical protein
MPIFQSREMAEPNTQSQTNVTTINATAIVPNSTSNDQYLYPSTASGKQNIESFSDGPQNLDEEPITDGDAMREVLGEEPRNIILAMLSQVSRGMDLHRIAFPTFVLEPRSMLERITDFMAHPQLIIE